MILVLNAIKTYAQQNQIEHKGKINFETYKIDYSDDESKTGGKRSIRNHRKKRQITRVKSTGKGGNRHRRSTSKSKKKTK